MNQFYKKKFNSVFQIMHDKQKGKNISAFLLTGLIVFLFNLDAYAELECDPNNAYRSIDGTCNNLFHPLYGSAGTELLRKANADYEDGISSPSGETRPNPRVISNELAAQYDDIRNNYGASDYIWQWGQFLDHDISLTGPGHQVEHFDIEVPSGDEYFDSDGTGNQVIEFIRSIHNGASPRQQINQITAFIDASNVYGSDISTADLLRDPENPAKLKVSEGNLLPENGGFFMAGDVRANEQIGLTAMHTLFVREHNRLVGKIAEQYPDLTDEEIYQTTRKIIGAKIQAITYNEFLPHLLGPNAIPRYTGYDSSVNPGIANEFSTASYRYGHSQLSSNLLIMDKSGLQYVPLRDAFFNPTMFKEKGLESILQGLAVQKAQEIDVKMIDDVRNFLFGAPGMGGFDLISLNIQRGRDHGLPDYNTVRMAYNLPPVTSFDQISANPDIQDKLEAIYGNVNNIDLLVGGLAEDHVKGAMVGETIRAILIGQFTRLRDGDRFWYQNDQFFIDNKSYMKKINKTTLANIMQKNTGLDGKIQDDVFLCEYPKGGGRNIVHSGIEDEVC